MNKMSKISVYIAILIAFLSAKPWFIWGRSYVEVIVLFFFIISRLFVMKNSMTKKNVYPTIFYIILAIYIYILNASDLSNAFSQTCTKIIPVCLFLQFKIDEKKLFINGFTTIFSAVLLVSLFSFALFQCGFSLPYSRISHADAHYSEFYNYYTFIIDGHLGLFTRFRSIFTEPGHVGMFAAILLYINNFRLSIWKYIALVVSIIWSFSLAAYILVLLGLILFLIFNNRTRRYCLLIPLALMVIYFSVRIYYKNNSDSIISELIISRLEMTDDGNIKGNNRNTRDFLTYYMTFKGTSQYIIGLGSDKYAHLPFLSGNASYKNFILEHGIIGVVLLIAFGMSLIRAYPSAKYLGLFILYLAAFLQRPYALWEVELFLYVAYSYNIMCTKSPGAKREVETAVF